MPVSRNAARVLFCLLLGATTNASPAAAALMTDAPPGAGGFQTVTPFRGGGTGGSHVQEFYSSFLFGNFGGARSITELDFRTYPGAPIGALFGSTLNIPGVRISLSTTSAGDETGRLPSTSFAANIGSDFTTVFNGALSLTTTTAGNFDFRVPLQTAFTYDPSMGNLLLDVVVGDGAVTTNGVLGFVGFDDANNFNDGIYSVYNLSNGHATSGVASTDGAVTRFVSNPVSVPEPAGALLLASGVAALALRRRQAGSGAAHIHRGA